MGLGKKELFARRKARVRHRLKAVASDRVRLSVFRSNRNISVQIIDDAKGITLAAASTLEKDIGGGRGSTAQAAAKVGEVIASRAKEAGIGECYLDRGGYMYHGQVKALAEAARSGGLKL